jgi:hypothetical protein
MNDNGEFLRRKYSNGTQDSICLKCFLTAARGTEEEIKRGEANHKCEEAIRMECGRPLVQHVA